MPDRCLRLKGEILTLLCRMSCESFQEQFSWLYVCNSTPTFLDFGDQHCTAWSVERHISLWRPVLATGRSSYSPGNEH